MTDEKDFLSGYDPGDFPAFAVTADIVLLTMRAGRLCVLLIERGGPPFEGMWAFPGGFVRPDENLDQAASRELQEETGISGIDLTQFASYGDPARDPRMRVVTVSYLAVVPDLPSPQASTDAAKARFWPVDDVEGTLAFDHDRILGDALSHLRTVVEYSPLAASFCEREFTVADLRRVYESIWGVDLDPSNFQRKVLGIDDFLVPTDRQSSSSAGGGRPARLYRLGKVSELRPPILPPD